MKTPMEPANTSEAAIFEAALNCATLQERAAYLDKTCAGRPELRERIEELLAAHDQAAGFLENPQAGAARPTVRLNLPPEEQPGERIGRYKLLQKIGEGGCGAVYMAEQEEPVRRRGSRPSDRRWRSWIIRISPRCWMPARRIRAALSS
jgi:hypothetical protein